MSGGKNSSKESKDIKDRFKKLNENSPDHVNDLEKTIIVALEERIVHLEAIIKERTIVALEEKIADLTEGISGYKRRYLSIYRENIKCGILKRHFPYQIIKHTQIIVIQPH